MHAVFVVLAAAFLAANWLWVPVGTEAIPDSGRFFVSRTVPAVGNVSEWQAQFEHEWSRLQASCLWVFEGPGCFEVLYDFQGSQHERVGIIKFFGTALFRAPCNRVKRAQRGRPHKVEVTFGVRLVVPL